MKKVIRLAILSVAVAAVSALPAPTSAFAATTKLKGTVVHRKDSHAFVIADKDGKLIAVHSAKAPREGRVVSIKARKLKNSTFVAKEIKTTGRKRSSLHVRGTVTNVDNSNNSFTVSAHGSSLLVHESENHSSTEEVGHRVNCTADLNASNDLESDDCEDLGEDTNGIELEGIVLSVDTANRILTLTADDSHEDATATITVNVPDTFDLTLFEVGHKVELKATLNDDGSYTLLRSSGDDNSHDADNSDDEQDGHDQGDDQGGDSGGGHGNDDSSSHS